MKHSDILETMSIRSDFTKHQTVIQWQINKCTIADLQFQLSYESWGTILEGDDVNQIF